MGIQYDAFIFILNMSVTATYMAVFVWIIRLLLKKAPKVFSYGLWSAVLFRLICPYSFPSSLNIIGKFAPLKKVGNEPVRMDYVPYEIGYALEPKVDLGIEPINQMINHVLPEANPYGSINPMQVLLFLVSVVWVMGIMVLLGHSIISYFRICNKMRTAMLLKDNIYESDQISTPFVLGFIRPRIYLPLGIMEQERDYIVKHEQVHLRRKDHIIKLLAFFILTIHWFNPILWISYFLMSKDMEMSCDERVLRDSEQPMKKIYSSSLLRLASKERMISGAPLAFGESNIKERIKNVLSYRRPKKWVVALLGMLCTVCLFVLVSNPKVESAKDGTLKLAEELLEHKTQYVGDNSKVVALINLLPLPSGTSNQEIQLKTDEEPYEIKIAYQTDHDIYIPQEIELMRNAILLFATIDNVDVISYEGIWKYLDEIYPNFQYSYTREDINSIVGKDVREYANSVNEMEALVVIVNRMLTSENLDHITNFTWYVGGNSIGLAEWNSIQMAKVMKELVLSGDGVGTMVNNHIPETLDYIKIEIGEENKETFYVFKEKDIYFALYSGNQWEIPESSYQSVLKVFNTQEEWAE